MRLAGSNAKSTTSTVQDAAFDRGSDRQKRRRNDAQTERNACIFAVDDDESKKENEKRE